MMTRLAAPGPLLAVVLVSLALACSETKSPTSPDIRLSDDRLYLPVPEVRRTVDLRSNAPDAVAAKQTILANLNLARLVLGRMDTPVRRVRNLPWTWEEEGCFWYRSDAPDCSQLTTACDDGTRVAWVIRQSGRCGVPPRDVADAQAGGGWSDPYGSAGNLFTCDPGKPAVVLDRAEWNLLPGTRLVRWRLQQTAEGGGEMRAMLNSEVSPDGSDAYEFEFPDSVRFVGSFGSGGVSGTLESFAWRPALGGWVTRDRVVWSPGTGRWTHQAGSGPPEVRTWGSPFASGGF
jgi:hypothetical protein